MNKMPRRYQADHSRRALLKGTVALGLTLAAGAGRAHGQSASVVVINQDGSVSSNANAGPAKWISPSAFVASSLETGRIGYVTAWGGTGFGYAYTYSLSGQPAGVTIDPDMGFISIRTALAVGAYTFNVIATTRGTTTTKTQAVTLKVVRGVTANPASGQILHKTYTPESVGGVDKLPSRMLADQATVGDGLFRATINFTRGKTYTYLNNAFTAGIQFYTVQAVGAGALPILTCTQTNPPAPTIYQMGPLGNSAGSVIDTAPSIKVHCARINDISTAGATTATLMNAADASKLIPGRWHAVTGYCQQIGGYPPNNQKIDYVRVVGVSGATVTFDRPLKYTYAQNYWENTTDDTSLGWARIIPWDCGGTGGTVSGAPRMTQRGQWVNLHFVGRVDPRLGLMDIVAPGDHIDLSFTGCTATDIQLSTCKNIALFGCTVGYMELDKLSETCLIDNSTFGNITSENGQAGLTEASGFAYVHIRNNTSIKPFLYFSPRQLRMVNSTIDARGQDEPPFSFSYNGPMQEYEFNGCNFICGTSTVTWTWPKETGTPFPVTAKSWSGTVLVIPRTFRSFEDWLTKAYEGQMLSASGNPANLSSYGRITQISAPSNGSALYIGTVWLAGARPTSGSLYQMTARKLIWANGTKVTNGTWTDPWFVCQQGTPNDRAFPAGIS